MKHRSVIAFVIVVAALFSLPQLSHDLRALKGAVGARLQSELLHAFLNMPAGEPAAAAPAARAGQTLFASCTKEKAAARAAKSVKVDAGGRAEGRPAEKGFEQRAMIGDPLNDPVGRAAGDGIEKAVASPREVRVETEVAMIIPPESGIDLRKLATALVSTDAARFEADGLRVAYAAAARIEAKGPEWQRATEEGFRRLNGPLPGAYEFRVVRDGAKGKVLKFKCAECPAPRMPPAPRHVPAVAPMPGPVVPVDMVGE